MAKVSKCNKKSDKEKIWANSVASALIPARLQGQSSCQMANKISVGFLSGEINLNFEDNTAGLGIFYTVQTILQQSSLSARS